MYALAKAANDPKKTDVANTQLLKIASSLTAGLTTVGGDQMNSGSFGNFYPWEHYQRDAKYIGMAIQYLKQGDVDSALKSLGGYPGVTMMHVGKNLSPKAYKDAIIDRLKPDRPDLYMATGRLSNYTDLYHAYFSLLEKKNAGNTDYAEEIAELQFKYDAVATNLKNSILINYAPPYTIRNSLITNLSDATGLLIAVAALVK